MGNKFDHMHIQRSDSKAVHQKGLVSTWNSSHTHIQLPDRVLTKEQLSVLLSVSQLGTGTKDIPMEGRPHTKPSISHLYAYLSSGVT